MKKRRKNVSSPNYIAKSLRSSKYSQKVIQSKKLYNRKKDNNGDFRNCTSFDLSIEEIIQEAYERCGMTTTSGHSLKSARTSLNLLFAEWANRGIHLWKVALS